MSLQRDTRHYRGRHCRLVSRERNRPTSRDQQSSSSAGEAGEVTVRVAPLNDDSVGVSGGQWGRQWGALFARGHTSEHDGLRPGVFQRVVGEHDRSTRATESDAGGAGFERTGVGFV